MKKLVLLASVIGVSVASRGQGYWNFDNTVNATGTQNPYSIAIGPYGQFGEGGRGQSVGLDPTFSTPSYDIGYVFSTDLTWVGAPNSEESTFLGLAFPGPEPVCGDFFLANTGDDADGAGFFCGGFSVISSPATSDGEHIAVQLLAWYDPTGNTSFWDAVYDGYNVGWSAVMDIRLASFTDPVISDASGFLGFQVDPLIPEPSTFALAGLGAVALLIFRRRK